MYLSLNSVEKASLQRVTGVRLLMLGSARAHANAQSALSGRLLEACCPKPTRSGRGISKL
ncbi:hypothetical protein D3C72_861920 [compost metagenome]